MRGLWRQHNAPHPKYVCIADDGWEHFYRFDDQGRIDLVNAEKRLQPSGYEVVELKAHKMPQFDPVITLQVPSEKQQMLSISDLLSHPPERTEGFGEQTRHLTRPKLPSVEELWSFQGFFNTPAPISV